MIELYEHQKTALDLLRLNDGFALFMEMGTGKTFPVLKRLVELYITGRIQNALIVAPKSVCESWKDKIGMLAKSEQAALRCARIVSYDIAWRRNDIVNETFDAVVFDESHYIKSPGAKRTQACLKLAARAKYRYILTGTPTSNGQLCNLWSQFAAIDPVLVKYRNGRECVYPACFGGDAYSKWLGRVAYLNQWRKPYKYHAVDSIQQVMGEMSYRITKAECLDLPEKLPDEILHCELESTLKRGYTMMMRNSAIVELDTLAPNPLTRSLRLRQMCSGFLDTENDEHHEYKCSKLTALRDFLADFEGKFVVFCDFRHSIDRVAALLSDMRIEHVILDGRQKDKGVWRRFQGEDCVRAIICQYASGSAGIDLYAADTCIFFEPSLSSNLTEQARDRIHRIGQHNPCSYIWLLTNKTIETAIYSALKSYEDFGEALFTQYIDEYTKGGVIR